MHTRRHITIEYASNGLEKSRRISILEFSFLVFESIDYYSNTTTANIIILIITLILTFPSNSTHSPSHPSQLLTSISSSKPHKITKPNLLNPIQLSTATHPLIKVPWMEIILVLQHRHALPVIANQPEIEVLVRPSELPRLLVDGHVAGSSEIRAVAERRLAEPGVLLHLRHVAVVHAEADETAAGPVAPCGQGLRVSVDDYRRGFGFGFAELGFPAVVC